MKRILLTQGKFAIVDADKYEWLNQWKWTAAKSGRTFYAVRSQYINGHSKTFMMHREILNPPKNMQIDHKDFNGLNNLLSNIRICAKTQNGYNQRPQVGRTSKYRGVGWHKNDKRWQSQIKIKGTTKHIGNYTSEIAAAKAYDKKAKELFGEFAYLNFG